MEEYILMGPVLWGDPASLAAAIQVPSHVLSPSAQIALRIASRFYAMRIQSSPDAILQKSISDNTPIDGDWLSTARGYTNVAACLPAAESLTDSYARKKASSLITEAQALLASTQPVKEGLRKLSRELSAIAADGATSRTVELSAAVAAMIGSAQGGTALIPTGFDNLDVLLGGWISRKLYILGGRPSMGKTAVIVSLILNLAKRNYAGIFYTMETDMEDMAARFVAAETGMSILKDINNGISPANASRAMEVGDKFGERIFINDIPKARTDGIRAEIMALRAGGKDVHYVVLDFLQLMTNKDSGFNKNSELDEITRELAGIAKELDVFIIAASQLSRATESRESNLKRPIMADLRESGGVEQNAYGIILLWRPAYYGYTEEVSPSGDHRYFQEGHTEMIIVKNKNGPVGTSILYWNQAQSRFSPGGYITSAG